MKNSEHLIGWIKGILDTHPNGISSDIVIIMKNEINKYIPQTEVIAANYSIFNPNSLELLNKLRFKQNTEVEDVPHKPD